MMLPRITAFSASKQGASRCSAAGHSFTARERIKLIKRKQTELKRSNRSVDFPEIIKAAQLDTDFLQRFFAAGFAVDHA